VVLLQLWLSLMFVDGQLSAVTGRWWLIQLSLHLVMRFSIHHFSFSISKQSQEKWQMKNVKCDMENLFLLLTN